jgi:phospholipid/cholesterol/gamma-HCH transport system substrate-binding protein
MDEMKGIAEQVKLVAQQLAKSVGTEQGGQNIRDTLKNLADVTDALNKTVRENREYLNTTLKSVAGITANANPQVASILENVRLVTEDVRALTKQTPGANGQVGELRQTADRVNKAAESLESALSHANNVAERIDKGEGTIGKLTKDETLINEVQGVAENVNDLVGGINRVQTQVNLRSDYNFLSNTIKSYVEVRLQPREDKYYLIELINDPRGKTSFEQVDVETTNPNDPARYRTVTTRTTDSFRFSLQFARRLGMFTGRFGIRESTGGVGLDTHLLGDKLEIRQDLFGFGEEIQPRYRVWLGYEFLNKLWLLGGVDHAFLSTRRDYFLGLQLRFTDEDLKFILPFAGGLGGR